MKVALICDNKTEYKYNETDFEYFNSRSVVNVEDLLSFEIAIILEPYTEDALKTWTGHPHLRCCNSLDEIKEIINALSSNIEIEKKYLIKMPDIKTLDKYFAKSSDIEQIYLESDIGSRRIRKRTFGNITKYFETLKVRIDATKCNEYEGIISKEEYESLKTIADKSKHPIRKTRYCFLYKKQYCELDIYDFWDDRATLEIELLSENQAVYVPPEIEVIKDVSEDDNYKNNHLARIPYEDYKTVLL